MTDLFGYWVPKEMIQEILNHLAQSPAKFLLLTKFPKRYLEFDIPKNCVCGATIESNRDYLITVPILSRVDAMSQITQSKMVSIEPIMDFDLESFVDMICAINPDFVAIGYDNYRNNLPEPKLEKTMKLIKILEDKGITVYTKTLREKHL
jgi:protein gp37